MVHPLTTDTLDGRRSSAGDPQWDRLTDEVARYLTAAHGLPLAVATARAEAVSAALRRTGALPDRERLLPEALRRADAADGTPRESLPAAGLPMVKRSLDPVVRAPRLRRRTRALRPLGAACLALLLLV